MQHLDYAALERHDLAGEQGPGWPDDDGTVVEPRCRCGFPFRPDGSCPWHGTDTTTEEDG